MGWIKLDDTFFSNQKIVSLSKDATLLYLSGLCYAGANLTDGVIPTGAIRIIAATAKCRAYGFPSHFASNMARLLRELGTTTSTQPTKREAPKHRQEKLLRGQITTLVNKLASRRQCHPEDVNRDILTAGFPKRSRAQVHQLEAIIEYLELEIARHGR